MIFAMLPDNIHIGPCPVFTVKTQATASTIPTPPPALSHLFTFTPIHQTLTTQEASIVCFLNEADVAKWHLALLGLLAQMSFKPLSQQWCPKQSSGWPSNCGRRPKSMRPWGLNIPSSSGHRLLSVSDSVGIFRPDPNHSNKPNVQHWRFSQFLPTKSQHNWTRARPNVIIKCA